jgi:hypothetical protein
MTFRSLHRFWLPFLDEFLLSLISLRESTTSSPQDIISEFLAMDITDGCDVVKL